MDFNNSAFLKPVEVANATAALQHLFSIEPETKVPNLPRLVPSGSATREHIMPFVNGSLRLGIKDAGPNL